MKPFFSALGLAAVLLASGVSAHAAETASITTLEWPPYTASTLPKQGISSAIVSEALAAEGIEVHYVFLPWNRAIETARHGAADGFFPAYKRPPNPLWVVSKAIGAGPIYFAQRRSDPVAWTTLDDLRNRSIGVDAGFVNTTEIDQRLADGRLHGDVALSDTQNLRKLASNRIDLAIIDGNVFRFLLSQPKLAPLAPELVLQGKPLENKDLFVEFRNTPRGQRLCDALDRGLAKIGADSPAAIAALQNQLMAP